MQVDQKAFAESWNAFGRRIEILDVRKGAVVASARLPGYPLRILADGRVATYIEDDDGNPRIDVWAIRRT